MNLVLGKTPNQTSAVASRPDSASLLVRTAWVRAVRLGTQQSRAIEQPTHETPRILLRVALVLAIAIVSGCGDIGEVSIAVRYELLFARPDGSPADDVDVTLLDDQAARCGIGKAPKSQLLCSTDNEGRCGGSFRQRYGIQRPFWLPFRQCTPANGGSWWRVGPIIPSSPASGRLFLPDSGTCGSSPSWRTQTSFSWAGPGSTSSICSARLPRRTAPSYLG